MQDKFEKNVGLTDGSEIATKTRSDMNSLLFIRRITGYRSTKKWPTRRQPFCLRLQHFPPTISEWTNRILLFQNHFCDEGAPGVSGSGQALEAVLANVNLNEERELE